jgi:protein-tyrosine phosphatase
MIDLHNHLLPAIDDGPADIAETIRMCRIAAEDGIRAIVATPHSFNGSFVTAPEEIRARVAQVNDEISRQGINLQVLPGMEIRIVPNMMELLSQERLLALNDGRYFLIEFPLAQVPAAFDTFLATLRVANYGVVIGHPEKNVHIQRNPGWLAGVLNRVESWDLVAQISADSLTGDAGRAAYKTARTLLKQNLVHVIATDAHSSVRRPPQLSKAVEAAAQIVGEERAHQMVEDVPFAVLTGEGFPSLAEPEPPKKWWKIF